MRPLFLCFFLLIISNSQAQDTTYLSLVRQFYGAINEKNRSNFNAVCYQYNSNQAFYKEAYRTFFYRSKYKVVYELDEINELEIMGGYENDSIQVQYGTYSIREQVNIGNEERREICNNLNSYYNTKSTDNQVDPLNILRKVVFLQYEYEPGLIEGMGEEYFLFITTKASGITQLIPFDLLHSSSLTRVFKFEFILEAFQLTNNNCDATSQDMKQLGHDVFSAIQSNEWLNVYCKYGITAEVEDPTGEYDFGRTEMFNKRQNNFLHELHVRQDIVRIHIDRIHRKIKDRSPELYEIHLIEQEENGKQFLNVLIEIKMGDEFDYILVVCQRKQNDWRINNGPLLKFYGEPILKYIKKLRRK
jgi:hypothetical protein